jgi:hypothetical protein
MLSTSARLRIAKAMPRMRSLASKKPSREARTAIRRVLPATPLVPMPLPSIAAIRPPTKVPWPMASGTLVLPVLVSKVSVIRAEPPKSGWLTSSPVSMTATVRDEPPPAAAIASPARTLS